MDLSTTYCGLKLPHPFIPGASPWTLDLDKVRQMEDAGAAAIVMPSLFEEQIVKEQLATTDAMDTPANSFAEALSYFPNVDEFRVGGGEYLERLRKIKAAVNIPVIASLNGVTAGGWLDYAKDMAEAGAAAVELNVYYLPTGMDECGRDVEQRTVDLLKAVKDAVEVPVAVKLSPFYSSIPCLAGELDKAGADGLVLFNRFYQPNIDIETLEMDRALDLSTSKDLLLRLRWLAVLSGRVNCSLAVTGGVHTVEDAVKAIMTGADAIQMVSAILQKGAGTIKTLRTQLAEWLEKHEYKSLEQMKGSMNLSRSPDPSAYERANYVHILQTWNA